MRLKKLDKEKAPKFSLGALNVQRVPEKVLELHSLFFAMVQEKAHTVLEHA